MKFSKRKLYAHGQNKSICLLQIPKLICENLSLTSEDFVDIDFSDDKIVITKYSSEEEEAENE